MYRYKLLHRLRNVGKLRDSSHPPCYSLTYYDGSSGFVRELSRNLSKSSRLPKYALPGLYADSRLVRIHERIVSSGTVLPSSWYISSTVSHSLSLDNETPLFASF